MTCALLSSNVYRFRFHRGLYSTYVNINEVGVHTNLYTYTCTSDLLQVYIYPNESVRVQKQHQIWMSAQQSL